MTEDTTWLNWSDRTSHLSNDQISADVLSVPGSGSPFSVPRSTFPVSYAPFPIAEIPLVAKTHDKQSGQQTGKHNVPSGGTQ